MSPDLDDEVTVLLNGLALPSNGAEFTQGETRTITLSYKNTDVLENELLAIEVLPDHDLVEEDFECQPSFGQLITPHEWKFTPKQLKTGAFKLKLMTEGGGGVLLTPTNRLLGGTTFRYIGMAGSDLPLPPVTILIPFFSLFMSRVRLIRNGLPLAGAPVTFYAAGEQPVHSVTDADGIAKGHYVFYSTTGIRAYRAVATISSEERTVEGLVEVYGGAEEQVTGNGSEPG